MSRYLYAYEKPDCEKCMFYNSASRSRCFRGKLNCYYLVAVEEDEGEVSCKGCPYRRPEAPCIGFCMKKIVTEMKEKWNEKEAV